MLRQAILLYFSFEEKSNKQDSKACDPFSVFLPVIHDSCMKNKHLLVWWLHMRKCRYSCLSSWILWTMDLNFINKIIIFIFVSTSGLNMTRKSHDGWGKACRLSMRCMTTSALVNLDVEKAFFLLAGLQREQSCGVRLLILRVPNVLFAKSRKQWGCSLPTV